MTSGVEFKDGHWWANTVDEERGARSFLCESESEARRFLVNWDATVERIKVEREMVTVRRKLYEHDVEQASGLKKKILALHEPVTDSNCAHCLDQEWPCITYVLARDSY